MTKILLIGNVSWDHIIHVDELPKPVPQAIFAPSHYYAVGGSGAGKAFNMNQLGIEFTFATRFAHDAEGLNIKEVLDKEGIEYKYDVDPISTVTHTNLMDVLGDRVSIFTSNGSDKSIVDVEKYRALANEADIVILNISNFCKEYIPILKDIKAEIWTDLHDYDGVNEYHQDFIDIADVVFVSSDKVKNSYSDMVDTIKDKKFIVCTHGSNGSDLYTDNLNHHEPVIPGFEMIDTNGAGDAFFTGYLFGYINGYDSVDSMRFGTIMGGLTVESKQLFNEKTNEKLLLDLFNEHYKKSTS